MKHTAHGTHSNGTEVCVDITDLSTFINASSTEYIFTSDGDGNTSSVMKGDVIWDYIGPENANSSRIRGNF